MHKSCEYLMKTAGAEMSHFPSYQFHVARICVFQMNPAENQYLCTSRRLKMRRVDTRDFTELSLVASPLVILTQWAPKKVSASLAQCSNAFDSINRVLS